MKIKNAGFNKTTLNQFDLLGKDEIALSKAFAYILSKNKNVLYTFLHNIGIKISNTDNNYRNTEINIEKHRKEGRTDIEIYQKGRFHVIIECKIKGNIVTKQRRQYINSFSSEQDIIKAMVFISQKNDTAIINIPGIKTINIQWINIVEMYNTKAFNKDKLIREFIKYAEKRYNMREQKEILIQDLGDNTEIERFKKFNVYRRDEVYGTPLYFAPYFTRSAHQKEGERINYLSKILGIITFNPMDEYDIDDELLEYANNDRSLVKKWKRGIILENKKYKNKEYTFFFLANPVRLTKPLLKDKTIKKQKEKLDCSNDT